MLPLLIYMNRAIIRSNIDVVLLSFVFVALFLNLLGFI